jgi:murein DD-endopeptidase MepM/ murein hydrolase activator NlpD
VTTFRKGSVNPNSYRIFANSPSEYFDFMMSNTHENTYNNLMSNHTEGTFNAVCLSGFESQNNTGTSTDVIDGFLDVESDRLHIIIRPLVSAALFMPSPIKYSGNSEDIYNNILLHRNSFLAVSSFNFGGSTPINFGQIIKCRFSQGSLQNSDFSGLEYDEPSGGRTYDSRFFNLLTAEQQAAAMASTANWSNAIPLGAFVTNKSDLKPTSTFNETFMSWQIPDSVLPIAPNLPHKITSIMGTRTNPVNPASGKAEHGGVDIGQAEGSPLYAIFDGEVVSIGVSGKPYINDPHGIYSKVGSTGYGLKVVIRHKQNNYAGEPFDFTLEYGHIRQYMVKLGDKVKQGQPIAVMGNRGGSTGAHLHLQMRKGPTAHSGGKLSALAMFGWHNRLGWKSLSLKNKWLSTWPEIANEDSIKTSDPDEYWEPPTSEST